MLNKRFLSCCVILFFSRPLLADIAKFENMTTLYEYGMKLSIENDLTGNYKQLKVSIDESIPACLKLIEFSVYEDENYKVISSMRLEADDELNYKSFNFHYALTEDELNSLNLVMVFVPQPGIKLSGERARWCRERVNTEIVVQP